MAWLTWCMSLDGVTDVGLVERAIRDLDLTGRPIEIHVSLRSFGRLAHGAATIVEGVLAAGSTVLAATMAPELFGIPAPLGDRPERNGIDYATQPNASEVTRASPTRAFDPSCTEVSTWLGRFSAHAASREDRRRCKLATGEFTAVGTLAERLIGAETEADVFGPLRALVEENGAVVLMGVDLTKMTLLHLAEVEAGRRPFVWWAQGHDGRAVRVRAGECSNGFESLAAALATIERAALVAQSSWRVFPAREALRLAAHAIRANPSITHCPNPDCIECADAIAGGPLG